MNLRHILTATLLAPCIAFADTESDAVWELKLSSEIKDTEICERALAHFARYCEVFPKFDPTLHPSFDEWERGGIQYAWYDFDADGELDLFIRNRNADYCGTLGCANYIIFHDILTSPVGENYLGTDMAISHEPVFLHTSDDIGLALSYGAATHSFDVMERKKTSFVKISY